MDNGLLQALMMGAMANGASGGAGMPAADNGASGGGGPLGQGGMSPQLLQFASGAMNGGGLQGGVGKLMGGILAQKMRQRMQEQSQPMPMDPTQALP